MVLRSSQLPAIPLQFIKNKTKYIITNGNKIAILKIFSKNIFIIFSFQPKIQK